MGSKSALNNSAVSAIFLDHDQGSQPAGGCIINLWDPLITFCNLVARQWRLTVFIVHLVHVLYKLSLMIISGLSIYCLLLRLL